MRIKKVRIRADYNINNQVWSLDVRRKFRWKRIMKHDDLSIVKKMKDHLLQQPIIYTFKNNVPENPIRTRPSTWKLRSKLKRLKIKRSELPDSLREL